MSDYDTQRENMVDSQLRTNEVKDHRVLKAMLEVPREKFVPAARRGFAYMDREILVDCDETGSERYMLSPVTLAKLIQLAGIGNKDIVLVVGCTTGYTAAVLATLAGSIVCLEQDAKMAAASSSRLEELHCDNAATVEGSLVDGYSKEGPYDVILCNGGVEVIPDSLFAQLQDHGRLVAIELIGENLGRAKLYRKIGDRIGEVRTSFDAFAHSLPGFQRRPVFAF